MGLGVNICASLVGLAAFARWTLSWLIVPQRVAWVNLLGGVSVLALFFSIVSPDDDGRSLVSDRPLELDTHFHALTPMHSMRVSFIVRSSPSAAGQI